VADHAKAPAIFLLRPAGHIARLILALIASEPYGAWLVSDICKLAYPGVDRIEKKHRVAAARKIGKVE
jgi:hypothetical protein